MTYKNLNNEMFNICNLSKKRWENYQGETDCVLCQVHSINHPDYPPKKKKSSAPWGQRTNLIRGTTSGSDHSSRKDPSACAFTHWRGIGRTRLSLHLKGSGSGSRVYSGSAAPHPFTSRMLSEGERSARTFLVHCLMPIYNTGKRKKQPYSTN